MQGEERERHPGILLDSGATQSSLRVGGHFMIFSRVTMTGALQGEILTTSQMIAQTSVPVQPQSSGPTYQKICVLTRNSHT